MPPQKSFAHFALFAANDFINPRKPGATQSTRRCYRFDNSTTNTIVVIRIHPRLSVDCGKRCDLCRKKLSLSKFVGQQKQSVAGV